MVRALTLSQPWASLVALGAKKYETRDWRPTCDLPFPLAIHAAKNFPEWAQQFMIENHHARQALVQAGYTDPDQLPRGLILATCQVAACLKTDGWHDNPRLKLSPRQLALGNWSPGRWAWELRDVIPLREPVPARGTLSLWDWDEISSGIEVVVTGRLPGF